MRLYRLLLDSGDKFVGLGQDADVSGDKDHVFRLDGLGEDGEQNWSCVGCDGVIQADVGAGC